MKKYLASYISDAVTQSACDLAKAAALATAVGNLAMALRAGVSDAQTRQLILTARTQAQYYEVEDNIDLVDFCSLLQQATGRSEIALRCQEVINAVESGGYVLAQGSKGSAVRNSHGVAIYFPTVAVSPLYAGLDFSKKTGWDAFLKAYVAAVRSR